MNPTLLQKTAFILVNENGTKIATEISAVLVPISKERASVMFVDNNARVIYGQIYVSDYDKNEFVTRFVNEVIIQVRAAYQKEVENALRQGGTFPLAEPTLHKIKKMIASAVQKGHS